MEKNEKILINEKAREKILNGCRRIAEIVKLTLGPKGRNVLIERKNGEPLVTNDGATIAREVFLECPYENISAKVLKEASIKTNTLAGDGTTTAILLAAKIMEKGLRQIALGESPIFIKEGILAAADIVVNQICETARPINDACESEAIATNSCANYKDGKMVAKAVEKVGANGIVTVEENKNGKTDLIFIDGLEVACELASPYFCEDVQTLSCVFEDAKIFITDQKIFSIKEILPFLEEANREKLPLIIIADDFSPEVISALLLNKVRGGIRVAALKCGIFEDRKDAILNDLAALCGATLVSKMNDLTPAVSELGHLGNCDKVVMGLETSKFISNGGDALGKRIELIKAQIAKVDDEYNKTRLSERLARLENGVAIISVGCASEIEQKEKRLRIEDALNATRAACQEGIVAGGGIALLDASKVLRRQIRVLPNNQRVGAKVLLDCLDSPLRQICINAGQNADIIISKCRKNFGYDANKGVFTDMFKGSVIDPAKVVKTVIRNAASVAGTLLTTEAIIC